MPYISGRRSSTPQGKRKAPIPSHILLRRGLAPDSREAELYSQNATTSPLLKLPPELRWMIYDFLLSGNTIFVTHDAHTLNFTGRNGSKPHAQPKGYICNVWNEPLNPWAVDESDSHAPKSTRGFTLLSGVCRQLYQETATIPFEANVWAFRANVLNRLVNKERRLPLPQRRAMKTLIVEDRMPGKAIEKLLSGLELVFVDREADVVVYDLKNGRNGRKNKNKFLETVMPSWSYGLPYPYPGAVPSGCQNLWCQRISAETSAISPRLSVTT